MSCRECGCPVARVERFVTPDVNEFELRQEAQARAAGSKRYGPLVTVTFPTANADRAVAHGLGVVPDGFEHARCTGAVYEVTWAEWTPVIALLRAPVAYTIAVGRFFVWTIQTTEDVV